MQSCPLTVTIDSFAAMLNCEFVDHPEYDALELQWFDDDRHGRGMLAFFSRRSDRRVDYYVQSGLRLDRSGYEIGGGIGAWVETDFKAAQLLVSDDGVLAEASFTDVDGRTIEVRIDDRDSRPRRRAALLAPVSSGTHHPTSLMLVWLPGFDLVHITGQAPVIRIDGIDAAVGRLPGEGLHRRILVKYAAPVVVATLAEAHDGPIAGSAAGQRLVRGADGSITAVTAEANDHTAHLRLVPQMPDLRRCPRTPRHTDDGGSRSTGAGSPVAAGHSDGRTTASGWDSTSPNGGDRDTFRFSCGWSPPSCRCFAVGPRPTVGEQPSSSVINRP